MYYVSIFLTFLDPTHPPYQHKYSTERQQKGPVSIPTQPVFFQNLFLIPKTLSNIIFFTVYIQDFIVF